MKNNIFPLQNWIPLTLYFEKNQPCCNWLYTADKIFTQPFFDGDILKCKQHPFNSKPFKCVSSLDFMEAWSDTVKSIPPTAFIFHVSRCGSTLLSQLLSLDPGNIVLSEVPFFDELLRAQHKKPNTNVTNLSRSLKAAVKFYGSKKNEQTQLFIKTDSWHIFFHQALRAMYPGVPFFLLYRRPDEVMRSQQKQRGLHAVPGLIEAEIFGLNQADVEKMNFDNYLIKVLENYYRAFLDVLDADKLAIPMNYNEGAKEMMKKIAAVTSYNITDENIAKMKERAAFHGKHPEERFSEAPLEQESPDQLKQVFDFYNRLEIKRRL